MLAGRRTARGAVCNAKAARGRPIQWDACTDVEKRPGQLLQAQVTSKTPRAEGSRGCRLHMRRYTRVCVSVNEHAEGHRPTNGIAPESGIVRDFHSRLYVLVLVCKQDFI